MVFIRTLLISIFILFTTTMCSQRDTLVVQQGNVKYELKISEQVYPIVEEYFSHEEIQDLDLNVLDGLLGIYVVTREEMLDLTYPDTSYRFGLTLIKPNGDSGIFINGTMPVYLPKLHSLILYHEMYHLFIGEASKNHCTEVDCPYILRNGFNIEMAVCNWNDEQKKEYFKYIIWKQKEVSR